MYSNSFMLWFIEIGRNSHILSFIFKLIGKKKTRKGNASESILSNSKDLVHANYSYFLNKNRWS